MYIKHPDWINLQRKKADQWLAGAGGKRMATDCLMSVRFPLGDEII